MIKGRLLKDDTKERTLDSVKITLSSGGIITITEEKGRGRIRVHSDGASLLYIIPVVSNAVEIGCVDSISKKKRKNKC